jgi:hypothetical protein
LWANHYSGAANGLGDGRAIALDKTGNVFVTGNSAGSATTNDFATIAYSASGVVLWTNRYNGPAMVTTSATRQRAENQITLT